MSTTPQRHPRAKLWGLERWIGDNGNGSWERVAIKPPERGPDDMGPLQRWFPIESYSEAAIRMACGPGRFRVWWKTASRKHLGPTEPFELAPDPAVPSVEPSSPEPPPAPEHPAPPAHQVASMALVPPGYVPKPPPGYMPPPAEPAFERYHHLAGEDADRVVVAVTNLGAAFQAATAQMAAATIAVSGQRASEWQALSSQLLAHAMAPRPADPALAQLIQGQQAMAAALQALAGKVEGLEAEADDDDEPPIPQGQGITGAQVFQAALPLIERVATPLIDRAMNAASKPEPPKRDGSAEP